MWKAKRRRTGGNELVARDQGNDRKRVKRSHQLRRKQGPATATKPQLHAARQPPRHRNAERADDLGTTAAGRTPPTADAGPMTND